LINILSRNYENLTTKHLIIFFIN